MKLLVHVRAICDFCEEGAIHLHDGPIIRCPYCDGLGFFERWDNFEELVKLFLAKTTG